MLLVYENSGNVLDTISINLLVEPGNLLYINLFGYKLHSAMDPEFGMTRHIEFTTVSVMTAR
jgi:SMC interacting uncharacterized protein involved in chromosome segregation